MLTVCGDEITELKLPEGVEVEGIVSENPIETLIDRKSRFD
jgi:hypothetical protein